VGPRSCQDRATVIGVRCVADMKVAERDVQLTSSPTAPSSIGPFAVGYGSDRFQLCPKSVPYLVVQCVATVQPVSRSP
jgi:hypothetical protein